jgi:hypothetical protein
MKTRAELMVLQREYFCALGLTLLGESSVQAWKKVGDSQQVEFFAFMSTKASATMVDAYRSYLIQTFLAMGYCFEVFIASGDSTAQAGKTLIAIAGHAYPISFHESAKLLTASPLT